MLITDYAGPILLAALVLDAFLGEPNWLWRRLPHPVVLMGRLIAATDTRFNHACDSDWIRRALGVIALVCWTAAAIGLGLLIAWLLSAHTALIIFEVTVVAILLAQRSLYDHVDAVRCALDRAGLAAARMEVAKIVGRNPETLDTAAVCRASIESTAENFSDGVVAPAFWYFIAGLPGLLAYKMINTADSMVGHRTERHQAFGWAAARLDDLVNLLPARLSAAYLTIAAPCIGFSGLGSAKSVCRDARKHRSPNAGWPEAAMAGALGLALAGPRIYGTAKVADAWMGGGGRQDATSDDIKNALKLMVAASAVMALNIVLVYVFTACVLAGSG